MAECLIVTMTFSVKPDASAELVEMLPRMFDETRRHPGFVAIRALRNRADPNRIIMIQEWGSLEDYQAYVAWRSTDRGGSEQLQLMFAGPPSVEIWDHGIG